MTEAKHIDDLLTERDRERVWGIPSEIAVVEEELAIAGCCGEGSGDGDGAGVEEDGAVASGGGDGDGVSASGPSVVA